MPIYEYRCDKCGQFEQIQKITDPALKKCPTCKGKVTKLMSSTSFQLKGSGWYITDYGRSGGGKPGGGESKSDSSTSKESGKDSGKSEAKTGDSKSADSKSSDSKSSDSKKSDTKAAAA